MHTLLRPLLVLLATGAMAAGAQAQSNTIKFGVIRYDPHSHTSGITGLGVPPGADATVGSANTLLFTYEREIAPRMGIEFVLGAPPVVRARGSGTVPFLGEVLSARNVAPTVLLNYHFGEPGAALRPFIGAGVNYTRFDKASTPYGWKVSLSDSWGLAGAAGVDYAISRQWGAFASIGAAQVKSDLVAVGASVLRSTIDFRPLTYSAGLFCKF